MQASPGCDMASFHASYRAKANLELIELARSLIVNLRVVRAPANYLVLSIAAIHRWEGKSANEWHHKVLFISRNYNSQAVSLAIYTDTFPLLRCCQAVFTVIRGHSQRRLQCSQSPIQPALSGVHQASLAAWPLHGDGAGFNYPQLCFISLPSWALCPSVLCKDTIVAPKLRWDGGKTTRMTGPRISGHIYILMFGIVFYIT